MSPFDNILASMPVYMQQDTVERLLDLALNRALDRARGTLSQQEQATLDRLAAQDNLTSQEISSFLENNVPSFNTIMVEEAIKLRDEIEAKLRI